MKFCISLQEPTYQFKIDNGWQHIKIQIQITTPKIQIRRAMNTLKMNAKKKKKQTNKQTKEIDGKTKKTIQASSFL